MKLQEWYTRQDLPLLIAGPCAVESYDICYQIAETAMKVCDLLGYQYVFKASYKKANRSSIDSFTGIGNEKALNIIDDIGRQFDIPTITDVHTDQEATWAGEVVDIIQIPAFLCRQTDLLLAAGHTDKYINIKKGQFLSPESMKYAAEKVRSTGNEQILLTERGTTFGYQDLVVDYRSIPVMKASCQAPVIMDCTHALQQPNQKSGVTGGNPEFISTLANAAMAVGANGLFIETHPSPETALSDGANMLHLDNLKSTLIKAKEIWKVVNSH